MTDYSVLYKEFVSNPKSLIIAPAGYGKTFTISECLKYTTGKQLILTHTHAGISSIKTKILESKTTSLYSLETISSFAQKYVEAFIKKDQIPDQEDKQYYSFIIKKATELLCIKPISKVITATYTGVFVDEYQDCTISQHNLISSLGKLLPIHILGDPLQGIFTFNNEKLVDFNKDLSDFRSVGILSTPWRWKDKNSQLGEALKDIRNKLESLTTINLSDYKDVKNFFYLKTESEKIREKGSEYRNWLNGITFNKKGFSELNNVLIITPNSHSIWLRVALNKSLSYKYFVLEAFDESDFYTYSRELDSILTQENIYSSILILLKGKKTKKKGKKTRSGTLLTGLHRFFPNDITIPKPTKKNIKNINHIIYNFIELETTRNKRLLLKILHDLINLEEVNCTRKELFYDLCKAIKQASINNSNIIESMKIIRNLKRRIGRKTRGKYIGTTLLTKGLEFDTVVIIDADKFDCPKNYN